MGVLPPAVCKRLAEEVVEWALHILFTKIIAQSNLRSIHAQKLLIVLYPTHNCKPRRSHGMKEGLHQHF